MPDSRETKKFDIRPGKRFKEWVVDKKLDEGAFGSVYRVRHATDPQRQAALKIESNDVEGGSAIKLEAMILRAVAGKPHVPQMIAAGKRELYHYMVMTLLGKNLKDLRDATPNQRFTLATWIRVGIQTLYGLKVIHDAGFLHRDVKPTNMAIGHSGVESHLVYILDFGMARPYAAGNASGRFMARRARPTADFRGTIKYCSPRCHDNKEQGRVDDLYGWLYVLVEFQRAVLPWHLASTRSLIGDMKKASEGELLIGFPDGMHFIVDHLSGLNVYQRPQYERIYNAMVDVMKDSNVTWWQPMDWENRDDLKNTIKSKKFAMLPHEEATEFFNSDPINIHGPPPKSQKINCDMTQQGRNSE